MSEPDVLVRGAERGDVAAICRFGEAHVRPHYAPLIGAQAADAQVRTWWRAGRGVGPRLVEALIRQLPSGTVRLCVEHFAANERAGSFYEREGFTVERVEPSGTGDPALDVVWRVRDL